MAQSDSPEQPAPATAAPRAARNSHTVTCKICGLQKRPGEVMSLDLVHDSVAQLVRQQHPDIAPGDFICIPDLNRFRSSYVQSILQSEQGELSDLDAEVVRSMREQEVLSKNLNDEFDSHFTFGQRVADSIAKFGGSWTFILSFLGLLFLWIIINSVELLWRPFDPFPFILLNLVLSCVASLQAPVIMMSQNRQETKDRLRAEHDYQVNLKAELEIQHLNEKMDHLLRHQWERLVEIQQIQMDLMDELADKSRRAKP